MISTNDSLRYKCFKVYWLELLNHIVRDTWKNTRQIQSKVISFQTWQNLVHRYKVNYILRSTRFKSFQLIYYTIFNIQYLQDYSVSINFSVNKNIGAHYTNLLTNISNFPYIIFLLQKFKKMCVNDNKTKCATKA